MTGKSGYFVLVAGAFGAAPGLAAATALLAQRKPMVGLRSSWRVQFL